MARISFVVKRTPRAFLAVPGQLLDRGQSGRPVVSSFGNQPSDRLAMTGDEDLLAALDAVEQFGKPGLGVIGTD
jgi:hypothetical protein